MKNTSNFLTEMGSCMGRNSVHIEIYEPPNLDEVLQEDLDLSSDESINYNFHIYLYQKQMQQKERELFSWCGSKLALTEDIIRINKSRLQQNLSNVNEPIKENIYNEIEQLEEYRKKLVELMKHLKKLNRNKMSSKRVRKKRSHKRAVKIITVLTEAISKV